MKTRLQVALLATCAAFVTSANATSYVRYDFLTTGAGSRMINTVVNGVPFFSSLSFSDITLTALVPVGTPFFADADSIDYITGPTSFGADATRVYFSGMSATPGNPDGRFGYSFGISACFNNTPGNTLPTGTFDVDPACSRAGLRNFGATSFDGSGFLDTYSGSVYQVRVSAFDDAGVSFAGANRIGSGLQLVYSVPEPSTWAMILIGFGMVGAAMRYRRRSTKAVYV